MPRRDDTVWFYCADLTSNKRFQRKLAAIPAHILRVISVPVSDNPSNAVATGYRVAGRSVSMAVY